MNASAAFGRLSPGSPQSGPDSTLKIKIHKAESILAAKCDCPTHTQTGAVEHSQDLCIGHRPRIFGEENLGGHPKPAIRGHLKTGQRDS
jgi:hypothetical protein